MAEHIHCLNEKAKARFKKLMEEGKLVRVTPEQLRAAYQGNVTLITCGDGDKSIIQPLEWAIPRLHKGEVNFGGLLWLAKSYPGYDPHDAERIRWKLRTGMKKKGSGILLDLAHAPCAMADGSNPDDYLRYAAESRLFLLEDDFYQGIMLENLLHLDYMEGDIRIQEYHRINS